MLRQIMRPQQDNITIKIPNSYIDTDIELLVIPLDIKKQVKEDETTKAKSNKSLKGVFGHYADSSKISQETDAWSSHITDKYSPR